MMDNISRALYGEQLPRRPQEDPSDPITQGLAAISPEWARNRAQFGGNVEESSQTAPEFAGPGEDGVLRGLAAKTQQPYRSGWGALPGVASSIVGGPAARKLRQNEQHRMQGERTAWGSMGGQGPDYGAAMRMAPMGGDAWKYARNKMMAANDPDARLDRQMKEARLANLQRQPERRITKAADGRNYYTDTQEPVFPDVQPQVEKERRIIKGADGRNYWTDTGKPVLPNIQAVPSSTEFDKARQRELGKGQAKAQMALPGVENSARRMGEQIDAVINHPSRESATGPIQGRLKSIWPGTRDVDTRLEQLRGGAFLQAFESLKGGGTITEVEGAKAQAAIARLQDQALSDDDFLQALQDAKREVTAVLGIARQRAGYQPRTQMSGGQEVTISPTTTPNHDPLGIR